MDGTSLCCFKKVWQNCKTIHFNLHYQSTPQIFSLFSINVKIIPNTLLIYLFLEIGDTCNYYYFAVCGYKNYLYGEDIKII